MQRIIHTEFMCEVNSTHQVHESFLIVLYMSEVNSAHQVRESSLFNCFVHVRSKQRTSSTWFLTMSQLEVLFQNVTLWGNVCTITRQSGKQV